MQLSQNCEGLENGVNFHNEIFPTLCDIKEVEVQAGEDDNSRGASLSPRQTTDSESDPAALPESRAPYDYGKGKPRLKYAYKHVCRICNLRFARGSTLRTHLSQHKSNSEVRQEPYGATSVKYLLQRRKDASVKAQETASCGLSEKSSAVCASPDFTVISLTDKVPPTQIMSEDSPECTPVQETPPVSSVSDNSVPAFKDIHVPVQATTTVCDNSAQPPALKDLHKVTFGDSSNTYARKGDTSTTTLHTDSIGHEHSNKKHECFVPTCRPVLYTANIATSKNKGEGIEKQQQPLGKKPFSCGLCLKLFCTKGELSSHLDEHASNTGATTTRSVSRSVPKNSPQRQKFRCKTCSISFGSRLILREHNKSKHST